MREPVGAPPVRPVAGVVGGTVAGTAAGLFGVGGGILLVPLITLVFRRPQHVAHATSLVAITLGAAAGVGRFAVDGSVAVAGGLALAVGAVVGARGGAAVLPRVSEGWLRRLFSLLVLGLAVRFLVVGASGSAAVAGATTPELTPALLALHVVGGLAAGAASAVLGVGGGVILVPLLVLGFGYGQHVAEGTSLAVIVPTALTGAWSHHRHGYTDLRLGVRIGLASVVGSLLGASLALSLAPVTLGRLYGALQLVVGLLMLRPPRRPDAADTPEAELAGP